MQNAENKKITIKFYGRSDYAAWQQSKFQMYCSSHGVNFQKCIEKSRENAQSGKMEFGVRRWGYKNLKFYYEEQCSDGLVHEFRRKQASGGGGAPATAAHEKDAMDEDEPAPAPANSVTPGAELKVLLASVRKMLQKSELELENRKTKKFWALEIWFYFYIPKDIFRLFLVFY